MELVIKIPDKKYEALKMLESATIGLHLGVVEKAIINGTPLPKGHGDLVDLKEMVNAFWDGNFMEIWEDDLKKINVVVEADKEVDE